VHSLTAVRSADDLCLQCGICCGPHCFTAGKLEPDEIEPFRAAGGKIVIWPDGYGERFGFPCPLWIDRKCSVHADPVRPKNCGEFECFMLIDYLAGARSREECEATIALMLNAETRVDRVRRPITRGMLVRRLRRKLGHDPLAGARAELERLLVAHVRVPSG